MIRHGLLWIIPVALLVTGLFGIRFAEEASGRVGADPIVGFLRKALDRSDKLNPPHVESVLGMAGALEEADFARQRAVLESFDAYAWGCVKLAGLSAVLIAGHWLATRQRSKP